jgi:DNA mismatch endonuclease (patch repair protein)
MADFLTPSERSKRMASIRSKDTLPERQVRSLLHAAGLRFRLHVSSLPGHPDIVLPRHRVVVFVHGCFWHGHSCQRPGRIESLSEFWRSKIERNRVRDTNNRAELKALGWTVSVVWECELSSSKKRSSRCRRLARQIAQNAKNSPKGKSWAQVTGTASSV